MDTVMEEYISNLRLGQLYELGGMAVVPLFNPTKGPVYLTLMEALVKDLLEITEVSESGVVDELRVKNKGKIPVLLLDGEEIMGAKQNRVINTTIMVPGGEEITITVSCTEQGRWYYRSNHFQDSEVMAAHRIRRSKSVAVNDNLEKHGVFKSNQAAVWNNICEISREAKVNSPTMAMKDVYQAQDNDLQEYMEAFPALEDQNGILVFINGEVSGFEVISSKNVYRKVHPKIIKSYALEAILKKEKTDNEANLDEAENFLETVKKSQGKAYKSIGDGFDHRYKGEHISGSSLIDGQDVIHSAFFKLD